VVHMRILVSVYVFFNAYLFAPRSRDLLEKLVNKCPTSYGRRTYITEFTRARSIHSTPPSYSLKIHINNTLPSTPGFSKWSLPQVSPPKPCMHLSSPHTCHRPRPSHSSRFVHPSNKVAINTKLFFFLLLF
jgi:hypothetical protein